MITYTTLRQGFDAACLGPAACDRIEMSESRFAETVDLIIHAFHAELDAKERKWKEDALAGNVPVLFHAAIVVKADVPENQVRFINSIKPGRSHIVTI